MSAGRDTAPGPVLERAAAELARLGELAVQAQDAAALLFGRGAGGEVPVAAIVGLQSLDALAQHLAALSTFLGAVAEGLPDDLRVDIGAAERDLPLASLRARLAGRDAAERAGTAVELF